MNGGTDWCHSSPQSSRSFYVGIEGEAVWYGPSGALRSFTKFVGQMIVLRGPFLPLSIGIERGEHGEGGGGGHVGEIPRQFLNHTVTYCCLAHGLPIHKCLSATIVYITMAPELPRFG